MQDIRPVSLLLVIISIQFSFGESTVAFVQQVDIMGKNLRNIMLQPDFSFHD